MADHNHNHSPGDEDNRHTPIDSGSQALSEALRSSFVVVKVVMVVLVVVFFGSGLFTVREGERAIRLRFGKPVGDGESALLGPGLHWSWPYPIEAYEKIPITAIQNIRSKVGWYATTPEQELAGTEPPPGPSLNPAADGYVLTADGNIVHTRADVQYRVADPISYVFDFNNASNTVQNALDNALLWASSRFTVDQVVRSDQIAFRDAVWRRLEALLAEHNLGIVVEQCTVNTIPPRNLREAFANVLKAEIERNKSLQGARSDENQKLSKASADAQARINLAESDRARLVAEIQSRASEFEELLPKFQENPKLFVELRMADRMPRILTNLQEKIFLTERKDKEPKELRLLLNREPVRPAQNRQ
jgi:membrane protease subunit HflK